MRDKGQKTDPDRHLNPGCYSLLVKVRSHWGWLGQSLHNGGDLLVLYDISFKINSSQSSLSVNVKAWLQESPTNIWTGLRFVQVLVRVSQMTDCVKYRENTFLPILLTLRDAQKRSNKCNFAYSSFLSILKSCLRYKGGLYLAQSVNKYTFNLNHFVRWADKYPKGIENLHASQGMHALTAHRGALYTL